ncbi:MAG: TonB-dependent receptor plug domain-containing protein, partial [Bacteroidota bacterium]
MKIVFQILTGIFILFIQTQAGAQTKDTLKLGEVEIVSSRVPTLYSESARVITVIEKDEIEQAPVQSVQELLEYVLNVDVRQYGNHGVLADVSVRGGSFDQTLILLNGVKVSDPQTGHHSMNLPIELENVQRIEILEGPGSRVYGANAFSGAINIITGSDKERCITTSMTGGEHLLYNTSVDATYNIDRMDNYLSVSRKGSSGYIDNTDFKIGNIFYQTAFRSEVGDIKFQTGYNQKAFGAHNFYQGPWPNQFEKTKTTFANVRFISGKKVKFNQNIYWRRHQDHYVFFRENPMAY